MKEDMSYGNKTVDIAEPTSGGIFMENSLFLTPSTECSFVYNGSNVTITATKKY